MLKHIKRIGKAIANGAMELVAQVLYQGPR